MVFLFSVYEKVMFVIPKFTIWNAYRSKPALLSVQSLYLESKSQTKVHQTQNSCCLIFVAVLGPNSTQSEHQYFQNPACKYETDCLVESVHVLKS